ncbi:hypothetical protein GCM10009617_01940 [Leifsonia poae]|uniref:Uncharacterized protein n=1 Tax=Leifsonia poae TaxID=110933 RepID=A0A9W6H746_9MICO|nr:hypothetical protein GCM10017584_01950 [Leifsonia poae]
MSPPLLREQAEGTEKGRAGERTMLLAGEFITHRIDTRETAERERERELLRTIRSERDARRNARNAARRAERRTPAVAPAVAAAAPATARPAAPASSANAVRELEPAGR